MKKLDVSAVTDSAQMKIKKGTLQFLQDANAEVFNAMIRGAIGASYDNSKVYILFGCQNSGDGNTYNISAGSVFYQGEVYLVDAASFSTTGSNTAVLTQVTTQYQNYADPVTFSDSSSHNVHNIRKIVIASGSSGSGISNWADIAKFSFSVVPQLNPTTGGIMQISGVYPNLIFSVPDTNQNTESGILPMDRGAASSVTSFAVQACRIGKIITISGIFTIIANIPAGNVIASLPVASLAPGLTLSNPVWCNFVHVGGLSENQGVRFYVDSFNPVNKTTVNVISDYEYQGERAPVKFTMTFICA